MMLLSHQNTLDPQLENSRRRIHVYHVTNFLTHQRHTYRRLARNFALLKIHFMRAYDSISHLDIGREIRELDLT